VQKRPVRVSGLLGNKKEDGKTERFQLLNSSDKENEEAAALPSTSLKPARSSVTSKQLQAKHKKEERDTDQERHRLEIFRLHQCAKERCSNYRSCCFIYKKNHYQVTPQEQMK
jgi:hypothetical protein